LQEKREIIWEAIHSINSSGQLSHDCHFKMFTFAGMNITIDNQSGFCFGVVYAIQMAEDELNENGKLYCLGDIVHNNMEVERLQKKGLVIIQHQDLENLRDCKVLIRAHGEPPSTYEIALRNNIQLIDASCPVVLKLQNRIREGYEETTENNGQIVIYGLEGHAEVNGLKGQTQGNAVVVMNEKDLDAIDFSRPIKLYTQTTKSTSGFLAIKKAIEERLHARGNHELLSFEANDTLCRQVSNREPQLEKFAALHDVIIFVGGRKSSNAKILFEACHKINHNTHFISTPEELDFTLLEGAENVGICGATSTPMWLMELVADRIKQQSISLHA
jgi:4-hydroxy-3-methylbut-2-enyl diphosphate reductase